MRRFSAIAIASSLSACTAVQPTDGRVVDGAGTALPREAHANADGFLTIGEMPPSAYPADPPDPPETRDTFARRTATGTEAERAQAWEEANGPADFQAEVQRLAALLPQAEAGNFVQIRLAREDRVVRGIQPLIGAEVWFKRDAEATLAQYTKDPRIFARTGGESESELSALQELWGNRLQEARLPGMVGSDPTTGTIEVSTGLTEQRFRALAAQKGWKWDDEVRFIFVPEAPPPFSDPALERYVRVFARQDTSPAIQLTALGIGRIVLEDGCFRFQARKDEAPGALAMFAYDSQLTLDEEGYLAIRTANPWTVETYRVGEMGAWGGPNGFDEDSPDVKRLRERCGEGEIVNVGSPQSLRLFALPANDWVADYAEARRLTYDQAWDAIIACYRRGERRGREGLELRDGCIDQFNSPR